MKILIGADFMPGDISHKKEEYLKTELFKGKIKSLFDDYDFRILNLETPITSSSSAILKCGKNQKTSKESLLLLKNLQIDLLAMANNHILDYEEEGLHNTIDELNDAGIAHLGAGNNLKEAKAPYIIESQDEQKIGIFNCCEHEYSIVTDKTPGANPFDPLTVYDDVKNIKQNCDLIIVLYHGGKEYYPFPTPELQRICRKFIDSGADIVIVQHTHCIGCEEKYKDGCIIYGQGNFYSNGSSLKIKHESLLVSIDTVTKKIDYIPFYVDENSIYRLDDSDGEKVLSEFWLRSEQIKDKTFIENSFHSLVVDESDYYRKQFVLSNSIFERVVNRISVGKYATKKCERFFAKQKMLSINNIIECEAHRELFIEILKRSIYGEK